MQINKVRWLNLALEDFIQAVEFISKDDSIIGQRVAEQIWSASQSLKIAPNRGRSGRLTGTRELILQNLPYLLVYRVKNKEVQIIRLLHSSRNYL